MNQLLKIFQLNKRYEKVTEEMAPEFFMQLWNTFICMLSAYHKYNYPNIFHKI